MKAFLWHQIAEVSNRYHPEGSVLIVAESVERARGLAVMPKNQYGEDPAKPMVGVDRAPDAVFEAPGQAEKVWVFVDSGCC